MTAQVAYPTRTTEATTTVTYVCNEIKERENEEAWTMQTRYDQQKGEGEYGCTTDT
jgi:hypothetical protein